jgi:hypothetical protein
MPLNAARNHGVMGDSPMDSRQNSEAKCASSTCSCMKGDYNQFRSSLTHIVIPPYTT